MKRGFDTKKYLKHQTQEIKQRLAKFDKKLYLEFGGKLLYDRHAQRVLPGYEPDAKVQLLKNLKNLEIIYCISAKDIQKGRIRHDFGLTYDLQAIKEISEIREKGLKVCAIVITRYENENLAIRFKRKLENAGNKVYVYHDIPGYPKNIKKSLKGFNKRPYIKTKQPLIIVTGTGGGSGKMAVCLTQLYHEQKRNINAGYAKFETFPIWNLALNHEVNIAYEAATADLKDVNMIDPYHLKKYKKKAVNYNRDIENFYILKRIMKSITKTENFVNKYNSPTDMGVNMAKQGIINDKVIRQKSKQEIVRRYLRYKQEFVLGIETQETIDQIKLIMKKAKVSEKIYPLIKKSRQARKQTEKNKEGNKGVYCGAAIELPSGKIIKAHNSHLLHAESAVILKALKKMSGIPKKKKLLPKYLIKQMIKYKKKFGYLSASLNVEEILILLAIGARNNAYMKRAINNLNKLENLNLHLTHIPKHGDEAGLNELKLNVTTDSELGLQPYMLV